MTDRMWDNQTVRGAQDHL